MVNRVGVVEPVGGHGGMNYYDISLINSLRGHSEAYLFTCDEVGVDEYNKGYVFKTFGNLWKIKSKFFKFLFFFYAFLKTLIYFLTLQIRVCHFHFFKFTILEFIQILIMKIFQRKIVVTVHDVESFEAKDNSLIVKMSFFFIDHAIVHNEFSLQSLRNYYDGTCSIIKHGSYVDFFERTGRDFANSTGPLEILFFGQIKNVKGLDILINSLGILKNSGLVFRLRISGKFWKSDDTHYKLLVSENGLEEYVYFDTRYIPDEEVYSIYSAADIVVLPYKKIYQSGVLLMAMSIGVPVLVSDLIPMKDVVSDGENGFLFKSENCADLANKIFEIAQDRNLLKSAADHGYETMCKEFGWKEIGIRTAQIYDNI